ncbi:flavin reductase [Salinisphaera sp. P385]|uniref:Flavin reductase n=1 Tax=Spectribacter acetivorans TaxID=3075603 RepID=A0ABU3BCK7_9GAMM|nr:flavin reductase [Salinisphaera sp. P385]MDT0618988.1 flavin reductase [Salinisphaera sp. P385]
MTDWQHFDAAALDELDRVYRLNLINSVTGVKAANLVGTRSRDGRENLAVFSSAVHLGSNPPFLGLMLRPTTVPRHSHENIQATGVYTLNAITGAMAERAHYTSAKFGADESEFEHCRLTPHYRDGFDAPFVAESPIRIGLRLTEEIPIRSNGTALLVGQVETLEVRDDGLMDDGAIDLAALELRAIAGLNRYHPIEPADFFPYARPDRVPDFRD